MYGGKRNVARSTLKRLTENYNPVSQQPSSTAGKIVHIDFDRGFALIEFEQDGTQTAIAKRRDISGVANGHVCVIRQGDHCTALIKRTQRGFEARDVRMIDVECQASEFETSEITHVTEIEPGKFRIFAERTIPNCRCPILVWLNGSNQDLRVGD
jgi:hypothetical protein